MDYVIAETYTLPSKGKVYDVEVNPNIQLRSMTTNDEMKRLSKSDRPYEQFAQLIDDCMVTQPGISSYDMCIGDFQYLLHKLRIVTYGPDYPLICTCPLCNSVSNETINLEEMNVLEHTEEINQLMEFDLPRSKNHISLRLQTPRMIDDVNLQVKDFKRRAPSFTGDSAILFTIKSLVKEIDYSKPDPLKFDEWVQNLPMMDTNFILKTSQKLNESVGIDVLLENTCDMCGLTYPSTFRVTSEFFGPSI